MMHDKEDVTQTEQSGTIPHSLTGVQSFPKEPGTMTDLGTALKVEGAKLDRAIAALSDVVAGITSNCRTGKRRLSAAARLRRSCFQNYRQKVAEKPYHELVVATVSPINDLRGPRMGRQH